MNQEKGIALYCKVLQNSLVDFYEVVNVPLSTSLSCSIQLS
jgi:hypothetical protein